MEKILISACLLGAKVRYNASGQYCEHPLIKKWLDENRLISVCPEVSGGGTIPRAPSEIIGENGGESVLNQLAKIKNNLGEDVTDLYLRGAESALKIAKSHAIKIAILKERSPSCGSTQIYDGSFSGIKKSGMGITTALLRKNGIKVFSENEIDEVALQLNEIENGNGLLITLGKRVSDNDGKNPLKRSKSNL